MPWDYRNRSEHGWNPNDEALIKGLIFLGEGSIFWRKATQACRDKALQVKKYGWKPTGGLVADDSWTQISIPTDDFDDVPF